MKERTHAGKQGTLLKDDADLRSLLTGLRHEPAVGYQPYDSRRHQQSSVLSLESRQVVQVRGLGDQQVVQLRLRDFLL
jgi:hypothetical protein